MQKFILYIKEEDNKCLQDSNIDCYLLESSLPNEFIKNFIKKAQEQNKIVLLMGNLAEEKQKEFHADGIVIDLSKSTNVVSDYKNSVKKCSKDAVIGVISRNRRHEAMLLSELEPDFLIFQVWKDEDSKNKELISWYNELFLIQSAIFLQDDDIDISGYQSDIAIINKKIYKILIAKKRKLD